MKHDPVGTTELAQETSDTQAARRRIQRRDRRPLLDELVEAARQHDRAAFDRVFDVCFGQAYAIAWRVTRNRERAEILTARMLCDAVKNAV